MAPLALAVTLAIACGGGSNDSESPVVLTGVFLDDAVEGIRYKTATQGGITNEAGEFEFVDGESVTFSLGNIQLPPATAKLTVTPLDMAETENTSDNTVVNIIRLLQTLDTTPDTPGIKIETEAVEEAGAEAIDNWDVETSTFAADPVITDLLDNLSSSENTSYTNNISLVSKEQALSHFEETLVDEGETFIANSNMTGLWVNESTDNELLALVFLNSGNYIHIEVDEVDPFDDQNETSGMEWGSYERDPNTGKLTVRNFFDNNDDTGLNDPTNESSNSAANIFSSVAGDTLTISADDDLDGTIDDTVVFKRGISNGIQGFWSNNSTENELLAFIFFADGTYVHLEVDEKAPIDSEGETSGMEWGSYTRDASTGKMTVTQIFDNNGDTGFNDFNSGAVDFFAQLNGDMLTLQFDDNNDGSIGSDESLKANRAFSTTTPGFTADNLAGQYQVTYNELDGLASANLTILANGSASIVWQDGETDTDLTWNVSAEGILSFAGTIADVYTLTAGSASSGNLSILIDDNDGTTPQTVSGTITASSTIADATEDTIDDGETSAVNVEEPAFSFDATLLSGNVFTITYDETGTNTDDATFSFDSNGEVSIVWGDEETDNVTWTVNSEGKLEFEGSIADVITLTAGSTLEGELSILMDDNDGSTPTTTTGSIVLFANADTSDNSDTTDNSEDQSPSLRFDSSSLSGNVFTITYVETETSTDDATFSFNSNGQVSIVWGDEETDNATWTVNSEGKLVFGGSIADVITLTSGDVSSGTLSILVDDNDGSETETITGMIKLLP